MSKVNTTRLVPGDTIKLKCGDTWTGEGLEPAYSGLYDKTNHDSTYATTLATKTALYQGDGTKAAYKAVLTSDGMGATQADSVADSYVTHLAHADAVRAAFTAAAASSTWITLTSYSTGARPLIQPGGSIHGGIHFGVGGVFSGGWKIDGVDIDSCYVAGVLYDTGPRGPGISSDTPFANGLWIRNSHITNCTGMPVKTSGNPYPGLLSPYIQFGASGITAMHVNYLHIENVEIDHCDSVAFLWGNNQVWIESASHFHHCYINTIFFQGISNSASVISSYSNSLFENCEVDHLNFAASPSGNGPGYFKGNSGPLMANVDGLHTMLGLNIHHNPVIQGDGIQWDNEGLVNAAQYKQLFQGCTFANGGGAGFLQNDTVASGATRVIIDQCAFTTNGTVGGPAVWGERTIGDEVTFTRNNVTRVGPTQKIFGGDATHVYTPTYDAAPAGKLFGGSNTVI